MFSCLLFCVVEKIKWWKKIYINEEENIFDSSRWLWKFKFNRWVLNILLHAPWATNCFWQNLRRQSPRGKSNWSYKGFLKVFMHKQQLNLFILLIFVSWRNELEGFIKWFCLKRHSIILLCFHELQYQKREKKGLGMKTNFLRISVPLL